MFVKKKPALSIMVNLYVTPDIGSLLKACIPSPHHSLIAFTPWSSFSHAALMVMQVFRNLIRRREPAGRSGGKCKADLPLIDVPPYEDYYFREQCPHPNPLAERVGVSHGSLYTLR
jgi:hypothetical protein